VADGFLLVGEVAGVLTEHGRMRCRVDVEAQGDDLRLTVLVPRAASGDYPETSLRLTDGTFEPLALLHDLQYLRDIGQVRSFAAHYGIRPEALAAFLEDRKEGERG
jgi:hypothetical protein